MTRKQPSISQPLAGIKVIDLSRVLAGPFCSKALMDLGADVLKIEPPWGDDSRNFGPFIDQESAYFLSLNHGKDSLRLDFKNDQDRARLLELLDDADILLENFRPRVMQKLGLDYDSLHARFPSLIYASITGFGHTGPYANYPAYDIIVQAMGGLMSITGEKNGPPIKVGTSIGDITAGLYASNAICASLYQRHFTKEGCFIDISMLDCQVAILENAIARASVSDTCPAAIGNHHSSIAPFGAFKTKDHYIVIACGNDALFAKLTECLELPIYEHFASNQQRCEQLEQLTTILEDTLTSKTTEEWLQKLQSHHIPCSKIQTIQQVLAHPQIKNRKITKQLKVQDQEITIANSPFKMRTTSSLQIA